VIDMSERRSDEQRNLSKLIAAGADIVGAGAGAGIGHFLGGAMGAAAGGTYGAMATVMLKDVALDFTYRALGEREQARVGAAVLCFAEKYQERLDAGEQPRQDGFFEDPPDNRSAAKELFEATLLAAQREHQEKKLRFFGNLMANIAFHPEIDRAQANHLIETAEALSYRQLCLLALFPKPGQPRLNLRQRTYGYDGIRTASVELTSLLQEIYALHVRNLVTGPGAWVHAIASIAPAEVFLYGVGPTLYDLMELYDISDNDLAPLITLLQ
jgi:hypothetical protein